MLGEKLHFFIILPLAICYNITVDKNFESFKNTNKDVNATFKDYLEAFEPNKVWEKIDKKNKLTGKNKTVADEFDNILSGIDETEHLLKLKIENGNPKIDLHKKGASWSPHRDNPWSYHDQFMLKRRLMELIKQAIYQARYKMTIMQALRTKYKRNAVYKMGFLMSKTDIACKMLASVAYKLHWDCSNMRQQVTRWLYVFDMLGGLERMLSLWFDIDLLTELVVKNDENCRKMLQEVISNRKHAWKFIE